MPRDLAQLSRQFLPLHHPCCTQGNLASLPGQGPIWRSQTFVWSHRSLPLTGWNNIYLNAMCVCFSVCVCVWISANTVCVHSCTHTLSHCVARTQAPVPIDNSHLPHFPIYPSTLFLLVNGPVLGRGKLSWNNNGKTAVSKQRRDEYVYYSPLTNYNFSLAISLPCLNLTPLTFTA